MMSPSTRGPLDYVAILRRNLAVIVVSVLAAVGVGWVAYVMTPKTYEAHASALILAGGPASVNAERASDLAGQLRSASYVQLAASDQVLARVALADKQGVLGDGVGVEELRERLTVTSPIDSAVLDVVATGDTGQAAAHLANAVVNQLKTLAVEIEWSDHPIPRPRHEIDVIDPARSPDSPVAPDFWDTMTKAAALGALLALVLVIGIEVARDRIVEPREALVRRAVIPAVGDGAGVAAYGAGDARPGREGADLTGAPGGRA
ncbi:YveK family protein [Gordonia aurantiaca]|uniref:YveK family protein n=1 Tax=Gordonia sp. B21 TaxID=3151852 RepID=UPI003263D494